MMEKVKYEKQKIEYAEKDGLLYPLLSLKTVKHVEVGKYGHQWMEYIRVTYPARYRSLVRFGELEVKAADVEEYAHELLENMEQSWLWEHRPKNPYSFMEMLQLRNEARSIAEKMVLYDVVYQFH